ncbi:MAG: hypothetical protein M3386_05945, partial [Actinomycetota bacterium]|nr:hypothetical protein [Actinomycetota bacterium]
RECDLAYHNQLMVLGWSMLAEGRTTLARTALERMPAPPARTGWLTYVRCHDDIGWAISDSDAASTGGHGQGHRDFLSAFYRGDFPLSFAEGEPFGVNLETGDERTCGGTAALCGISQALRSGDDGALDMGIRRLLALYGIAFGWGGVPMLYMGDEVAHADDFTYRHDPERVHDSRWRQRPLLDDDAVARRHDPGSVEGRVWHGIRLLVAARTSCPALHAGGSVRPLWVGDEAVLGWLREHPRHGRLLGLANVTAQPRTLPAVYPTSPPSRRAQSSTCSSLQRRPPGPAGRCGSPPTRCAGSRPRRNSPPARRQARHSRRQPQNLLCRTPATLSSTQPAAMRTMPSTSSAAWRESGASGSTAVGSASAADPSPPADPTASVTSLSPRSGPGESVCDPGRLVGCWSPRSLCSEVGRLVDAVLDWSAPGPVLDPALDPPPRVTSPGAADDVGDDTVCPAGSVAAPGTSVAVDPLLPPDVGPGTAGPPGTVGRTSIAVFAWSTAAELVPSTVGVAMI